MISFSATYKKCYQIFPFSTGGRIKTRRLLRIVGKFRTSWASTTTTSTGRSRSPATELSTYTPPTMTSGRSICSDSLEARKIWKILTTQITGVTSIIIWTLNQDLDQVSRSPQWEYWGWSTGLSPKWKHFARFGLITPVNQFSVMLQGIFAEHVEMLVKKLMMYHAQYNFKKIILSRYYEQNTGTFG